MTLDVEKAVSLFQGRSFLLAGDSDRLRSDGWAGSSSGEEKRCSAFGGKGPDGRICRAVLAAIVVLGLKHRTPTATDDAGGRVREFARRVESRKGSLSCQHEPGSGSTPDPTCIRHVAEILEEVL